MNDGPRGERALDRLKRMEAASRNGREDAAEGMNPHEETNASSAASPGARPQPGAESAGSPHAATPVGSRPQAGDALTVGEVVEEFGRRRSGPSINVRLLVAGELPENEGIEWLTRSVLTARRSRDSGRLPAKTETGDWRGHVPVVEEAVRVWEVGYISGEAPTTHDVLVALREYLSSRPEGSDVPPEALSRILWLKGYFARPPGGDAVAAAQEALGASG